MEKTVMNTKHTPGPWLFVESRDVWSDADSREEREDASPWCIATVHAREDKAVRAANARLIAAAPDLLEALREVAEFWAGGDAPQELTDKINAALAKAVQS
jgi:hypothetical protein